MKIHNHSKANPMKTNILMIHFTVFLSLMTLSCQNQDDPLSPEEEMPQEPQRIGFELVEIISMDSILVWMNDESITKEAFDSIQLVGGWRKNEPREGDPDGSTFFRSPDATEDSVFTRKELFGYQWLFNAQIMELYVPLPDNDEALLTGRYIGKYHQVRFNAGRTLTILISPDGDEFVRISRDANRATEIPIIPDTWQIEEREIEEDVSIDLPNPTLNIRAENNQDSFQGPVSDL